MVKKYAHRVYICVVFLQPYFYKTIVCNVHMVLRLILKLVLGKFQLSRAGKYYIIYKLKRNADF